MKQSFISFHSHLSHFTLLEYFGDRRTVWLPAARPSVAGSFARPSSPSAPLPVSPLPCLRSDTVCLILRLVTALQGPCQFFVLRECWTRPFSFSDSSLVGLRPFLLPLFHPARALCVVFVALCCLLRYWLCFYLN